MAKLFWHRVCIDGHDFHPPIALPHLWRRAYGATVCRRCGMWTWVRWTATFELDLDCVADDSGEQDGTA